MWVQLTFAHRMCRCLVDFFIWDYILANKVTVIELQTTQVRRGYKELKLFDPKDNFWDKPGRNLVVVTVL